MIWVAAYFFIGFISLTIVVCTEESYMKGNIDSDDRGYLCASFLLWPILLCIVSTILVVQLLFGAARFCAEKLITEIQKIKKGKGE